jgi:hypothetical protein
MPFSFEIAPDLLGYPITGQNSPAFGPRPPGKKGEPCIRQCRFAPNSSEAAFTMPIMPNQPTATVEPSMTSGERRLRDVLENAQAGVIEGKTHLNRLSPRASAATQADCQAGIEALQRVATFAAYALRHLPEDPADRSRAVADHLESLRHLVERVDTSADQLLSLIHH